MTSTEIDIIESAMDYLKTVYGVNLGPDFVFDVEKAHLCKDSVEGAVNYKKLYRKYLEIVKNCAYNECFSLSNVNGSFKAYYATCYDTLLAYDFIIALIYKSQIFEGRNEIPMYETLYGGLVNFGYYKIIESPKLPRYLEYKESIGKKYNDDYFLRGELNQALNGLNKENIDSFNRASIIYTLLEERTGHLLFFNKEKKENSKALKIAKERIIEVYGIEYADKIKLVANEEGFRSKSIDNFVNRLKNEDLLNKNIEFYDQNDKELKTTCEIFKENVENLKYYHYEEGFDDIDYEREDE